MNWKGLLCMVKGHDWRAPSAHGTTICQRCGVMALSRVRQ